MSLKGRLRVVLACAILQVGVLSGVPMCPEQIKELMERMNQAKLAHVNPSETDEGDGPSAGSRTSGRVAARRVVATPESAPGLTPAASRAGQSRQNGLL